MPQQTFELSENELKEVKALIKKGLETNSTSEMYSSLEELASIFEIKYRKR